jgi:hypothetical protein
MRLVLLLLLALFLVPPAHAQDWPPWEQERIQALESENRKLRRHLSGYSRWVRKEIREKRALARQVHSQGWYAESVQAVRMAAVAFGQPEGMLLRKARCESGMWPYAANPSSDATGLFQFMPGTFRGTPFGRFSIWDVHAQALAAAWMHARGRGAAWECR